MNEELEMNEENKEKVQNEENAVDKVEEVKEKEYVVNEDTIIEEKPESGEPCSEENKPETQKQTDNKKDRKGKGKFLLVGMAAAILLAGGSVYAYSQTPEQRVNSSISLGNKYLNEMDYEQAAVAFDQALEIEPRNREALLGIMEASVRLGDNEGFQNAFESYLNICCEDDTISEEDWRVLTQMALAAEKYYGETEYKEILQTLIDETQDDKLKNRYVAILNEEADSAWKTRDYEEVIARLEEAYRLDPSNEQIVNELIKIVEEYAEYCRKNQQYDDGLDCIARIRELLGDDTLFTDQESILLANQNSDGVIQEMLNQLNVYFEEDNIEGIQQIMEGEEWREQTDNVSHVFYSENLLSQNTITGKGTGIYKSYGNIYVYYGNFENGIRQGEGLWYYDNGDGTLVKYNLNWVNGIPQGEGICDRYSTLTIRGYGGVKLGEEKSHDIEKFNVVDGFYDGKYSQSTKTDYAQGSMEVTYVRGIGRVVDMPDEIAYFMAEGEQIIGWGEMTNGNFYWKWYSPTPRRVEGIRQVAQYTAANVVLE